MSALANLAQREIGRRGREAADNRARFPSAAELADMIRAAGMNGSITYAENDKGETIGKRDPGPWVNGDVVIAIADWNARVYGRRK